MSRVADAWRVLGREQRFAAIASLGLFISMFLPWYSKTDTLVVREAVKATQASLSAFQAFSFVEAAVLLVSASVLAMLFARGERWRFRLPGGDGLILMIAGGWSALLIFYRLLDKPGLQGTQRITATVGVEWGIFFAMLAALALLYAGARLRTVERPEPPLRRRRDGSSGEPPAGAGRARVTDAEEPETALTAALPPAGPLRTAPTPQPARPQTRALRHPAPGEPRRTGTRPRYPPAPGEQMSLEEDAARAEQGAAEEPPAASG